MRRFAGGLLLGVAAFILIAATIVGTTQFGPEFTVNSSGQVDIAAGGIGVGQGGTGGTTGAFVLAGTSGAAAIAINCNAAGDTLFTTPAAGGYAKLGNLLIVGESGSFTAAKVGIYTAASQGGNTLLAQTALSPITTTAQGTNGALLALTAPTAIIAAGTTLYVNVGTAQGGTCTANFYFSVNPLANG